jgi:hypothetical protein
MTVEGDENGDAWVYAEQSADSKQPATSANAAKAGEAPIGDLDDADDDVCLLCRCSNAKGLCGLVPSIQVLQFSEGKVQRLCYFWMNRLHLYV